MLHCNKIRPRGHIESALHALTGYLRGRLECSPTGQREGFRLKYAPCGHDNLASAADRQISAARKQRNQAW